MKKTPPQFMVIYRCTACNHESGFTEQDKPECRYCDAHAQMLLVSKQKITPEVMAARLKSLTDSMFSNLQSAFESMTEEDAKYFSPEEDPEKQMLMMLEQAKKLRDDVQGLELKEPEKK